MDQGLLSDGYSLSASTPSSVRSRTPPRGDADSPPSSYACAVPVELLSVPPRINDEDAKISDLYGLLFINATNNTTLLKHMDGINSNVQHLSGAVDQLRISTQEAQSSANFAVTAIQALSKTVDQKLDDFEKHLQSLGTPPSDPWASFTPAKQRASSAPPRGRNFPSSGMDYIEALVLGWPSFTRATLASTWLKELLDKVKSINPDLVPLFRPISGNFCKVGVFRFESFEERRDFIAIVKDTEHLLDFRNKHITTTLYIKACVPKDIAENADILRASVYQCHQILKDSSDAKVQILACYKTRTLVLFDTPITYYIDSENNRMEKREGGEFCVDRSAISRLASENAFVFDCDLLVQFLTKKFAGRIIVDK